MELGHEVNMDKMNAMLKLEQFDDMSSDELLEALDCVKIKLSNAIQQPSTTMIESSYIYGERMRHIVSLLNKYDIYPDDIQII